LYAIFRLPPLALQDPRRRQGAESTTHFDWSIVPNEPPGSRTWSPASAEVVHFQQDTLGRDVELRYFRDTDGRSDFVRRRRTNAAQLVECKWATGDDRSLRT